MREPIELLLQADLSHSRLEARAAALIITGQMSDSDAYGSTISGTSHSPHRLTRPNPEWPLRLDVTGRNQTKLEVRLLTTNGR